MSPPLVSTLPEDGGITCAKWGAISHDSQSLGDGQVVFFVCVRIVDSRDEGTFVAAMCDATDKQHCPAEGHRITKYHMRHFGRRWQIMYVVVYLQGLDDESSRSNHLLSTQIARRFPREPSSPQWCCSPSSLKSDTASVFSTWSWLQCHHMSTPLNSSHMTGHMLNVTCEIECF